MKKYIMICAFLVALPGWAIPQLINYQGYLTNPDGSNLDTTVTINFTIYNSPTEGDVQWTETHPDVTVENGIFNCLLGSITPVTDVFSADRWLGITVGSNSEMYPRQPIASVAHAFRVGTVDGSSGGTVTGNINVTGKANIGTGNVNDGFFAFVTGSDNLATGDHSVVLGGANNRARGAFSVVAGGGGTPADSNRASGNYSSVLGGKRNHAPQPFSTVGGGYYNWALGQYTVVPGGRDNYCGGSFSTIAGGDSNYSMYEHVVIAGGHSNSIEGESSTCGGGNDNRINNAEYATVSGGYSNYVAGDYATVSGGNNNSAGGNNATVSGGFENNASAASTTIGGGYQNTASVGGATVSGGYYNDVGGTGATICGGYENFANGYIATVGGGRYNKARGDYSVVAGGGGVHEADSNSVQGTASAIGGGRRNFVADEFSTIAGGHDNSIFGDFSTVAGGDSNDILGPTNYATIGGGYINQVTGEYSVIPGGTRNTVSGDYTVGCGSAVTVAANNAFVFGDGSETFSIGMSNSANFLVNNGFRIWTDIPVSSNIGVRVVGGGTSWISLCDSTTKMNRTHADGNAILDKISAMPIDQWNYKHQPNGPLHIGPMAQDFWSAFHLGTDSLGIETIDADGVLFAAVKELASRNSDLEDRVKHLESLLIQYGVQEKSKSE